MKWMFSSQITPPPMATAGGGSRSCSEPSHPKLPHQIVTSADAHASLDHIDGNPRNNKIENLRECTVSQSIEISRRVRNDLHGEFARAA